MAKIVYNASFGGFRLSDIAVLRWAEIKGVNLERVGTSFKIDGKYWSQSSIARNDLALVQAVEELGEAANGGFSNLRIEELPDGTLYRIDEYDGLETVETPDSYEWSVA